MISVLSFVAALWLSSVASAAGETASGGVEIDPRLSLPITLERLTYREGGKRIRGDLIVSEEGMEFISPKRTVSMPLDRIHNVSLGKMKGDVDTDWVVLAVGVSPPFDIVGLREGGKLGLGGRTPELFDTLLTVVRQQSAAQFKAPAGFRVYEASGSQCTFAIPEDWNAYLQSMVYVGESAPWGTTILSADPIRRVETSPDGESKTVEDRDLLKRVLAGEEPAFFMERSRAGRGMSCESLSKGARKRLLERARRDPLFGAGYEIVESPSGTAASVGGCEGLHIVGRSRRGNGDELVLELIAVARLDTLYLFGLRALADRHEDFRGPFANALASINFSVAR